MQNIRRIWGLPLVQRLGVGKTGTDARPWQAVVDLKLILYSGRATGLDSARARRRAAMMMMMLLLGI